VSRFKRFVAMFPAELVTVVVGSDRIAAAPHVFTTMDESAERGVCGFLQSLVTNFVLDMNDRNSVASPLLIGAPGVVFTQIGSATPIARIVLEAGVF